MIDTLYIEDTVDEYLLSKTIRLRYPNARIIHCHHYGEVFNRKAQNFRTQKKNPALILARKQGQTVLCAPENHGIGCLESYYFSHMLNCLYDCRYCFLQGLYRSASYVLFVNYEDFISQIRDKCESVSGREIHFFSGYDCDSLALEPITRFVEHFLPLFRDYPNALLELRTKSTQIRSLLNQPSTSNIVVAFSFTPEEISRNTEHKVPTIARRLAAIRALQQHGWNIGLRFDPLIYTDDFRQIYRQLFKDIFTMIDKSLMHSVSIGSFRMPIKFFKTIHTLYPQERLFASNMQRKQGMITYHQQQRKQLMEFATEELIRYVPTEKFFPCHD